jgi:hypothetical protein
VRYAAARDRLTGRGLLSSCNGTPDELGFKRE